MQDFWYTVHTRNNYTFDALFINQQRVVKHLKIQIQDITKRIGHARFFSINHTFNRFQSRQRILQTLLEIKYFLENREG